MKFDSRDCCVMAVVQMNVPNVPLKPERVQSVGEANKMASVVKKLEAND